MRIRRLLPLLFVGLLCAGIGFMTGRTWQAPTKASEEQGQEFRLGQNKFTNPLLSCEMSDIYLQKELKPFKHTLTEAIADETKNGHVKSVAIYFRDLNNGIWTGIHEKEDFTPASLLKLPIMIAVFKKAESDPAFLDKKLTVDDENNYNTGQYFPPQKTIQGGETYSIESLVETMIRYSDNNATSMLHAAIDTQTMTKTFSDLGVDVPNAQKPEDFMSVKQYASFFRILFNATYLNKDYSEKALSLLTKTEFTQGIVSGVPKTVSVSHKFGETRYNNLLQLHDCGIVYFPKKPYLLCIMTRGDNANDLTHVISHLSQSVYEQVSLQMQSNQ